MPIGDSVGALAEMVAAGKIGAIGLSEVSVARLREAQAVTPIAAVQNEYSLWRRNAELGMLDATREDGVTLVAFSPVARGFLADAIKDPGKLAPNDIRRSMPRFQPEHWGANATLLAPWRELAAEAGCTPAQLALAWLLSRGDHVLPIPGTTSVAHLRENMAAADISVDDALLTRAGELIGTATISGARYAPSIRCRSRCRDFRGCRMRAISSMATRHVLTDLAEAAAGAGLPLLQLESVGGVNAAERVDRRRAVRPCVPRETLSNASLPKGTSIRHPSPRSYCRRSP